MSTKKTIKTLMLLSALTPLAVGLSGCASVDDGDFVNPITQYEKINGRWVVNTITQVDETNQKTLDLTNLFSFDSFVINFTSDGTNPGTFSVDGAAPAILPTSGTWQLENPFVNSDGSAAKISLGDKAQVTVTAVPGASHTLEFKLTRTSNGNPFVSYVYNLVPQGGSEESTQE